MCRGRLARASRGHPARSEWQPHPDCCYRDGDGSSLTKHIHRYLVVPHDIGKLNHKIWSIEGLFAEMLWIA